MWLIDRNIFLPQFFATNRSFFDRIVSIPGKCDGRRNRMQIVQRLTGQRSFFARRWQLDRLRRWSGDEIKHLMPKCMPCWQGLAKLFHCQKIIMPQDHKSGTLILWSNGFVGHVFKSRFTTIGCFFFCTRKEPPNFSPADLWGTANIKAKF